MITRSVLRSLLVAVVGATLVACSDEASTSSNDDDLTARPKGTDLPGKLLVRTPEGAPVAQSGFRASWNARGNDPLPINQVLSPIAVGRACFYLFDRYGSSSRCVAIESLKTTTFELGKVRYGGPEEITIGVDSIVWSSTDGSASRYVDDRQDVLRPAGTYHLSFGLFDGIDVTVAPGTETAADLASLSRRRAVDIASPARELANAPGCGGWFVRGSLRGQTRRQPLAVAPWGREYRLGEYAQSGADAGSYVLEVGNTTMPLPLSTNPGDPAHATVRPGRIDITDVDVVHPDGVHVATRGSYVIETQAGAVVCAAATNTGVDVAPGTYRLKVTYKTAEAGAKTDSQMVTVD